MDEYLRETERNMEQGGQQKEGIQSESNNREHSKLKINNS